MSVEPKHDCRLGECDSDPDHCIDYCRQWREWAEAEIVKEKAKVERLRKKVRAMEGCLCDICGRELIDAYCQRCAELGCGPVRESLSRLVQLADGPLDRSADEISQAWSETWTDARKALADTEEGKR